MSTEQKIDKILNNLNAQSVQIATFITHQEQHRKEIDENTKRIDKLVEIKNKAIGVVLTISAGISFIGIIIGLFLKKTA